MNYTARTDSSKQLGLGRGDGEGSEQVRLDPNVQIDGAKVFSVYGKEGKLCPKCGSELSGAKQSGRYTFWCTQYL